MSGKEQYKTAESKKDSKRTIADVTTYDLVYLRDLCQRFQTVSSKVLIGYIDCILMEGEHGKLNKKQIEMLNHFSELYPNAMSEALELCRPVKENEFECIYMEGKHIKKIKPHIKEEELERIMDYHDDCEDFENGKQMDYFIEAYNMLLDKQANLELRLSIYRKAAKKAGLKLKKGKLVPLNNELNKNRLEDEESFWGNDEDSDVTSIYDFEEQPKTPVYERELPKPKNLAEMVKKVLGNGKPESEHPVSELSDIEEYAKLARETEQLKIAYVEILQKKLDVLVDPATGMPRSLQTAKKLKKILDFLDTPKDIERFYQLEDSLIDEKTILANTESYLAKNKKPQN